MRIDEILRIVENADHDLLLTKDTIAPIAHWFRGWFMRSHSPADFAAVVAAFERVASIYRYQGPSRLWRIIPKAVTVGQNILPAEKRLQSWSETDAGARMFFGAEIAGRAEAAGPWTVIEAAIDPKFVVFSQGHITELLRRLETALETTDNRLLGRLWEMLEGATSPHAYQQEVIVLFPNLIPVQVLDAIPLRE